MPDFRTHSVSVELPVAEAVTPASALGIGDCPTEWLALSGAPAFQRVLQQRPCAKSPHFALHCLRTGELSTGNPGVVQVPVDDLAGQPGVTAVLQRVRWVAKRPDVPRLGLVVPKRHARRAVTRNLVKRQVRACWDTWWRSVVHQRADFHAIDWVVRLRAPIDRKVFISARSVPLGDLLRSELPGLLEAGARRLSAGRGVA